MKLKYVNKIKANISIYSSKKSTNILEGTYKSVYKGKSMNFENLREYVINDEVKDIDWKSSARSGTLLVKEFISEKKHNIMFVMDTGVKMYGDTDLHESKKEVALYTCGTIGYLALKNNDYIGMTYSISDRIIFKPFRYNLYNLEEYLCEYDKDVLNGRLDINAVLKYIYKNISKKMIIFVITDIDGLNSVSSKTLKNIRQLHDVLFVNINDNYMFGEEVYDVGHNEYIPSIFLNDNNLQNIEKDLKKRLLSESINKLKKENINMVTISSISQINNKIIKLLEEHKYASNN